MPKARSANFVVVLLTDLDRWGFDEVTLPMLLRLVDGNGAESHFLCNTGVTAYWVASPKALVEAEALIAAAEVLRRDDPRFRSLGIGLAHGRGFAEFDRKGRIAGSVGLFGTTGTEVRKSVDRPEGYREVLAALHRAAAAPGGLRPEWKD